MLAALKHTRNNTRPTIHVLARLMPGSKGLHCIAVPDSSTPIWNWLYRESSVIPFCLKHATPFLHFAKYHSIAFDSARVSPTVHVVLQVSADVRNAKR